MAAPSIYGLSRRALLGIWPVFRGSARLDGASLDQWDSDRLGRHIGYLPQDNTAREKRLRELENVARKTGQAQLWIETPYRNAVMLEQVLRTLSPDMVLCVAHGLTLASMGILSATVSRHRQSPPVLPAKVPAIFGIGP